MTSAPTEERLESLRREAWQHGAVAGNGVDVAGGPIPKKPGYYGEPVVRPPVWTWEIPIYFFAGGLSGMSALIAAVALFRHQPELARTALYVAAIGGGILSPLLLVLDLGRPRLFINMLRVFKHQSAMSMGVYILTFFGMTIVPSLIAFEIHHHQVFTGSLDQVARFIEGFFACGAAIFGTLLATYTGVLIGATVVPAWFLHRTLIPIHFGIAGLGSAAALLELIGHRVPALNSLGLVAASIETLLMIWLMLNRHGRADRALHHGRTGLMMLVSELLTGPIALVLRGIGLVPFAGISFLLGSLLSRFAWLRAGKVSAVDPEAVFASQR